jgi:putative transposase
MIFTMKYTAHPIRKTTFTKTVEAHGCIHALIPKGKPWRNGFIERSNRTDNEECFHLRQFNSSEERRYYHRLWEYEYNTLRPHQGLNNQTPFQVYQHLYPLHCTTRMLRT